MDDQANQNLSSESNGKDLIGANGNNTQDKIVIHLSRRNPALELATRKHYSETPHVEFVYEDDEIVQSSEYWSKIAERANIPELGSELQLQETDLTSSLSTLNQFQNRYTLYKKFNREEEDLYYANIEREYKIKKERERMLRERDEQLDSRVSRLKITLQKHVPTSIPEQPNLESDLLPITSTHEPASDASIIILSDTDDNLGEDDDQKSENDLEIHHTETLNPKSSSFSGYSEEYASDSQIESGIESYYRSADNQSSERIYTSVDVPLDENMAFDKINSYFKEDNNYEGVEKVFADGTEDKSPGIIYPEYFEQQGLNSDTEAPKELNDIISLKTESEQEITDNESEDNSLNSNSNDSVGDIIHSRDELENIAQIYFNSISHNFDTVETPESNADMLFSAEEGLPNDFVGYNDAILKELPGNSGLNKQQTETDHTASEEQTKQHDNKLFLGENEVDSGSYVGDLTDTNDTEIIYVYPDNTINEKADVSEALNQTVAVLSTPDLVCDQQETPIAHLVKVSEIKFKEMSPMTPPTPDAPRINSVLSELLNASLSIYDKKSAGETSNATIMKETNELIAKTADIVGEIDKDELKLLLESPNQVEAPIKVAETQEDKTRDIQSSDVTEYMIVKDGNAFEALKNNLLPNMDENADSISFSESSIAEGYLPNDFTNASESQIYIDSLLNVTLLNDSKDKPDLNDNSEESETSQTKMASLPGGVYGESIVGSDEENISANQSFYLNNKEIEPTSEFMEALNNNIDSNLKRKFDEINSDISKDVIIEDKPSLFKRARTTFINLLPFTAKKSGINDLNLAAERDNTNSKENHDISQRCKSKNISEDDKVSEIEEDGFSEIEVERSSELEEVIVPDNGEMKKSNLSDASSNSSLLNFSLSRNDETSDVLVRQGEQPIDLPDETGAYQNLSNSNLLSTTEAVEPVSFNERLLSSETREKNGSFFSPLFSSNLIGALSAFSNRALLTPDITYSDMDMVPSVILEESDETFGVEHTNEAKDDFRSLSVLSNVKDSQEEKENTEKCDTFVDFNEEIEILKEQDSEEERKEEKTEVNVVKDTEFGEPKIEKDNIKEKNIVDVSEYASLEESIKITEPFLGEDHHSEIIENENHVIKSDIITKLEDNLLPEVSFNSVKSDELERDCNIPTKHLITTEMGADLADESPELANVDPEDQITEKVSLLSNIWGKLFLSSQSESKDASVNSNPVTSLLEFQEPEEEVHIVLHEEDSINENLTTGGDENKEECLNFSMTGAGVKQETLNFTESDSDESFMEIEVLQYGDDDILILPIYAHHTIEHMDVVNTHSPTPMIEVKPQAFTDRIKSEDVADFEQILGTNDTEFMNVELQVLSSEETEQMTVKQKDDTTMCHIEVTPLESNAEHGRLLTDTIVEDSPIYNEEADISELRSIQIEESKLDAPPVAVRTRSRSPSRKSSDSFKKNSLNTQGSSKIDLSYKANRVISYGSDDDPIELNPHLPRIYPEMVEEADSFIKKNTAKPTLVQLLDYSNSDAEEEKTNKFTQTIVVKKRTNKQPNLRSNVIEELEVKDNLNLDTEETFGEKLGKVAKKTYKFSKESSNARGRGRHGRGGRGRKRGKGNLRGKRN